MDNASGALRSAAFEAKAWPFDEAKKLLPRAEKAVATKGFVLFETGYGPSGLPHIGTFGEVARTTMVRRAFRLLTGDSVPTQLFCVSDDMDGMRKIPDNVPNHEMLKEHLQKPLTDVPDPFGTHESFGAHNNARLRAFLDSFGFEYTFKSATELYRSGALDAMLLRALGKFDEIMAVMLPTLGPERQKTYSPFLPISPKTGRVLYVPMKRIDAAAGTVTFDDEDGEEMTLPVTGGRCKMQWKPDFGMRWAGLGVDFEMYGKDHLTNGVIYSKICSILGAEPPVQFNYELFLDDKGEKISKSKGNGISVEQWLTYASPESLALFMYQKPKTAKRLYFDVIPKAVDDYATYLDQYDSEEGVKRLESPIYHIHGGNPPTERFPVTFALLLNLVSASGASSRETLWGFIRNYASDVSPQKNKNLDKLVGYAVRYYEDFVKPTKRYRAASQKERAALEELAAALDGFAGEKDAEKIQFEIYEIGKRHGFEPLRDWFKAIYEVAFGQEQGPRFGTFAAIYGPQKAADLIRRALKGEFVTETV